MLPFDAARQRVLARARRLGNETVPVRDALNRVLAEDVHAPVALPSFDSSAMDGYAVRSGEFSGNGPWAVDVVGESRAGAPYPQLNRHTACRIFTGAELPQGADCVIIQENVERDGARIQTRLAPEAGQHVRPRGSDLKLHALALDRGITLNPFALGLLTALDMTAVTVVRKPRVALISTGDELRAAGEAGKPGMIPESNSIVIGSLVQRAGGELVASTRVGDDLDRTTQALEAALERADLVVTVGGVSVGDHDVVRAAMDRAGVQLDFWKVRIKPGKPLVFGTRGPVLVLGLPGNPVSSQITFCLFGLPVLRSMAGKTAALPPLHAAQLTAPLPHSAGRRGFYRGILIDDRFQPADSQSSGAPTLARSNALCSVPEDSKGLDAGATVQVMKLEEL